jgi:hypothetical protein
MARNHQYDTSGHKRGIRSRGVFRKRHHMTCALGNIAHCAQQSCRNHMFGLSSVDMAGMSYHLLRHGMYGECAGDRKGVAVEHTGKCN